MHAFFSQTVVIKDTKVAHYYCFGIQRNLREENYIVTAIDLYFLALLMEVIVTECRQIPNSPTEAAEMSMLSNDIRVA